MMFNLLIDNEIVYILLLFRGFPLSGEFGGLRKGVFPRFEPAVRSSKLEKAVDLREKKS